MTHRGDQVALELVQEAEPGHVVEYDGRPEGVAVRVADRPDLGQVNPILVAETKAHGLVERLGQVVSLDVEGVVDRLANGLRWVPDRAGLAVFRKGDAE